MMGVRTEEEVSPAPETKRQKLLPSPDSITATTDSEISRSAPVSASVPSLTHQLEVEPDVQPPQKVVKAAIPVNLITGFVLPYVPTRRDWNRLSITNRDISDQCQSSPDPPPWPDDKVINLRGTPWPTSLAISSPAQSEWIAFGTDSGAIRMWNAPSGQFIILEEHSKKVLRVEFSKSDQNLMLSCSEDGSVRLWNLLQRQISRPQNEAEPLKPPSITSRMIGDFEDVHHDAGGYTTACFCPNGELIACATWRAASADPITGRSSYISIWDIKSGLCLRHWGTGGTEYNVDRHNQFGESGEFNTEGFQTILFHPDYHNDSKYLVTQYNVRMDTVQVWDLNGDAIENQHDGEALQDTTGCPDDPSESGDADTEKLTLVPPATVIDPYEDFRHQRGPVYSKPPPVMLLPCDYRNNKRGIRCGALLGKIESNLVSFWTVPHGKFIGHAVNNNGVHRIISMAVSPHGDVLATCNVIGDTCLWQIRESKASSKSNKGGKNGGKLIRTLHFPDCSNIRCMAFTNNGRILVCVGMTGTVHFCDASVA